MCVVELEFHYIKNICDPESIKLACGRTSKLQVQHHWRDSSYVVRNLTYPDLVENHLTPSATFYCIQNQIS